jgi:predicted CopG family antitoxin
MKNITVSVDDDTYRRARMKAAEEDTSVSALVRQFLSDLAETETEAEKLRREEAVLRASVKQFRAADRIARDDLHQRGR